MVVYNVKIMSVSRDYPLSLEVTQSSNEGYLGQRDFIGEDSFCLFYFSKNGRRELMFYRILVRFLHDLGSENRTP